MPHTPTYQPTHAPSAGPTPRTPAGLPSVGPLSPERGQPSQPTQRLHGDEKNNQGDKIEEMTGASTDDRRQRQIGPAHIPVAKNPANRKPTFAPVAKGEHENSTTYPMSSFSLRPLICLHFLCARSLSEYTFPSNVMDCKEHMCGGERCVF